MLGRVHPGPHHAITDVEGVYHVARAEIETRQAANGACCLPNKSLKQDACTVNGAAGKCVPGGPAACKFQPSIYRVSSTSRC